MAKVYNPHRIAAHVAKTRLRLAVIEKQVKAETGRMKAAGIPLHEALVKAQPMMARLIDEEYARVGMDSEESSVRGRMAERLDTMRMATGVYGSNIFDMSRLARLFAHTDVDDVSLRDVELPYDAFYIHFGPETGIDVSHRTDVAGTVVEGAYVIRHPDPDAPGKVGILVGFVCDVPGYERLDAMPLGESLRRQTRAAFTVLRTDWTVAESIERIGVDGDPALSEDAPTMRAALRMLVNGLCYLSMPKADIVTRWPEDAPADWVRHAESPNAGNAQKYRNKLVARGYALVRYCGLSLRMPGVTGEGERGEAEPHWRRGHWRRQPHGTGSLQRKLIWLLPTVVNAHLGTPARGRVYDVQEPAAG